MTRRRRRCATLAVALATVVSVVGLGGATVVTAATGVNSCTTIDSHGEYDLTTSFTTSTSDACLEVRSSDVVLDSQNHTVTVTSSGTAVNVSSTASITNVTVRNLRVEGGGNGTVVDASPAEETLGVALTDNVVNNTSSAGLTVSTLGVNSTVTLAVANNTFDTDGDAIGNLDFDGNGANITLAIVDNTIISDNRGIDNPDANDLNQTFRAEIARHHIDAADEGIYGFELYGSESRHDIVGNTFDAGDEGIQFIEVGGGDDQTIDVTVSGNQITAGVVGIGNINPGGSNTTASIALTDNVVESRNGIDTVSIESDARQVNVTIARNDVTAESNGIQVAPGAAIRAPSGGLSIESNTVSAGRRAVVVESGPVTGVEIHNNSLAGGFNGVLNLNTTNGTYVNATGNYWNASDGPSSDGPYEDPVTGALANGSGSAVSNSTRTLANVRFDPWLSTSPPTPTPTATPTPADTRTEGPGFGPLVAVLGVLFAVAVLARRQ